MRNCRGAMPATRARWLFVVGLTASGCYEGIETPRALGHAPSEARPRAGTLYAPCGTELAEVDGVWAYSNGWAQTTADSCRGLNALGALEFQCVEFAQRYMNEIHGIAPLWPVNWASQMCESHPDGVTAHYDDYAPAPGDLAVWTEGYGHVAVVAEVLSDGIRIVEQNASAEGTRVLRGDPFNGYFSDWDTTPGCYLHADAAEPPPDPGQQPPTPDPLPESGAQCDALGYDGACYGSTSVWSQDGQCLVRDCASEGRQCGWIADGIGWGCLGGTDGATTFDCAKVGYEGVCGADDTLVWVEGGACRVVHCPVLGLRCGWDDAVGYDCV